MNSKRFIIGTVLLPVLLIFFVAVFWPLSIARQSGNHIVSVDDAIPGIVIVFGAGLRADGSPSDALSDRLQVAAQLYEQGKAQHILVSGDNRFEHYNEPQVMFDTLVGRYNIPAERIAIDFAGRRTYDTCVRARMLWNVQKAILVTQEFHLPRAIWTCEQLGIQSVGVSASLQPYIRQEYYAFREVLALYKAFIDVYLWQPEYVKGVFEEDLGARYDE